ncbi:hypothetical protein NPS29_16230 [Pseudomonas putida]|jgi:hypothetical protein|uniref:hypothetical protein n=1 Tax=Pseudomonas putida TaxID=303 RepID=UPI00236373FA|nr:hypothetical protein [Pseudomonas putida]MDD1966876.1 hypothetical protein [Pseudomonas putida]
MKLLYALLITTLMSLAALPGVQADSQPCNCQCQCEASPATSPGGSVLAIPKPPPPVVVEASNDELDLQTLGTADATVEVSYPEIADGHTAGLYWTSPAGQYRAPVQTVSGGAKKLMFKIPNATVVNDLGQSPEITASVGVANEKLVISEPRTITIISGAPPGEYPAAALPDFTDNLVDVGVLTGDLNVRVAYDSLAAGQQVKVLWRGPVTYDTPLQSPEDDTPLGFTIPRDVVIASLGKPVTLSYEVTLDGQVFQPSDSLTLNVVLRTLKEVPVIPSAVDGKVDLKALLFKPLIITYSYTGITPGHTAGIRWAGNPAYDTPHPAIGTTPRPLEFTIPYDKVRLERDKTVLVSASVGTGDNHLTISPEVSVEVVDTRPGGEEVAADLNARYNDTRKTCDSDLPSYYCNGVTIRGTVNGGYDPWDPSPTQLTKGSMSFSYLRKDARVTQLFRPSGYILLSQDNAIAQGKAYDYLCSYPHDGWTDLVGRPGLGCGLQPKANQPLIDMLTQNPELANLLKNDDALVERLKNDQSPAGLLTSDSRLAELLRAAPTLGALLSDNERMVEHWRVAPYADDLSTCAGQNAATMATWNSYSSKLTHPSQQCSLSAQDATQFDTSLKAREFALPVIKSTWNEVLVKVWPAGIPNRLPMEGFFYTSAPGLAEAKAYQQKYVTRTGGMWLPVIKLDMTKLAGNPFSYSTADQAVQP